MIDNIIINKAFVPEYPGEWAGGLIQVNTKDIPSKNFFNLQIGTGFNTQTTGKRFFKDSRWKIWIGWVLMMVQEGFQLAILQNMNSAFFTNAAKTAIGKGMRNAWAATETTAPLNISFQANGGFNTKVFGKNWGAPLVLSIAKTNKNLEILNRRNVIDQNV